MQAEIQELPTSGEQLRDAYPYEVYVNEKGKVRDEELTVQCTSNKFLFQV